MHISALADNPQWAAYKASLTQNGYFNSNIPGSAEYKKLLAAASQSFMHSQRQLQAVRPSDAPAETIATLLQQHIDAKQFQVTHSICMLHATVFFC